MELEIHNLLKSSWYLPDLNAVQMRPYGTSLLPGPWETDGGLGVARTGAIQSTPLNREIAFTLRHPAKGLMTFAK